VDTVSKVEEFFKCRACGAEQRISNVSGNVIWLRGGKVVLAEKDTIDQWNKMVDRYPDLDLERK